MHEVADEDVQVTERWHGRPLLDEQVVGEIPMTFPLAVMGEPLLVAVGVGYGEGHTGTLTVRVDAATGAPHDVAVALTVGVA